MIANLTEILKQKDITDVLVIDDGYDDVPISKDFFNLEGEWNNFFEDLTEEHNNKILSVFPMYNEIEYEELSINDDFIKTLWGIYRENEEDEIFKRLFWKYEQDKKLDHEVLEYLCDSLRNLDLNVSVSGRDNKEFKQRFDIIITDLYLSVSQNDIDESVNKINDIISQYNKKPLLILMSRAGRLDGKYKEFRDRLGFIESMFSIIEKKSFKKGNKLNRILKDLTENRDVSLDILNFTDNWLKGVNSAATRSVNILKTIDLADYKKIEALMLSAEGESAGNYIIDIMNNIFQYELENDNRIIESSLKLNDIKAEYLPRICKNTNLQEIVEKIHCKNNINFSGSNLDDRVKFGDIFLIENLKKARVSLKNYTLEEDNVILSISPACDLQRCDDSYNALFLKGKKQKFTIREWIKNTDTSKIIKFGDEFYIVNWEMKNPFTILYRHLKNNLKNGNISLIAKLKDAHTLSLKQDSLSQISRIGTIAPMPASSNINLKFYYKNLNKKLEEIIVEENDFCFSKIYTSHRANKDKSLNKLIISNELSEKLHDEIDKIDINNIDKGSVNAFKLIREDSYLESLIKNEGIEIPIDKNGSRNIIVNNNVILHVTNKIVDISKLKGLIICLGND